MSFVRGGSSLISSCLSTLRPTTSLLRGYATPAAASTSSDTAGAFSRSTNLFKTYKPVTPGLRHLRRPINDHLWTGRPLLALTAPLRKKGGRNHHGHITVRHRGGGHKRRLRVVDYIRETPGPHDVLRIEYDPNRSAHLALLQTRDPNVTGAERFSYILAPEGMRAGAVVESFRQGIPDGFVPGFVEEGRKSKQLKKARLANEKLAAGEAAQEEAIGEGPMLALGQLRLATVKPGNVLPLRHIPIGTVIHNVALDPKGPGRLVRSAGTFAQVVVHEAGRYSQVRLQSGEVRKIHSDCVATIGKVSNPMWKNRSLGKAGRSRWLGIRPTVRGMAMNKVDHPHGGGRGKSKSNKHPRSPWGWLTKGKRTRKPGPMGPKGSNQFVVKERPRGKEKHGP
ncbi:unnamed protein product [Peniophora sp. CBMAI 1063]|nr:unnamed protein product [Peniophora sp. CBMAI 1063]